MVSFFHFFPLRAVFRPESRLSYQNQDRESKRKAFSGLTRSRSAAYADPVRARRHMPQSPERSPPSAPAIALAAAALTAAGSLKETPMTPTGRKRPHRYVCHRADGPIIIDGRWTRRPGARLSLAPIRGH